MLGYDGDAISESEWAAAEDEAFERERMGKSGGYGHGRCFICGACKNEEGYCENGCDIED